MNFVFGFKLPLDLPRSVPVPLYDMIISTLANGMK